MATNHGSIEFLKFPNPQFPGDRTKLIKKWLRDSWARKKIVALQQAVSSIVIPTKTSDLTNDSGYITRADIPPGPVPSSTTPLMDGTAAVGTETAFARGDHRHPTDTSRQAALSAAQLAAVNSGITAETLYPTTISSLTPYSGRCTISDGGYIKIGNIVFLNVTIETAQASGTTQTYIFTDANTDLAPLSGVRPTLSVYNDTAKNTVTKAFVSDTGQIIITNCATAQTLRISGCYISA